MKWPNPSDCELDFSDFEKAERIETTAPESDWITEEEHAAQVEAAVKAWIKEEEGRSNGNAKPE